MLSRLFRRPAVLEGNRWTPADNELAVFFRFRDLSGLLTKALYVPSGMKGWVLRGDTGAAVELLTEGEHTIETLFQRMNNFFRSSPGEVLLVRTDAIPLNFAFDDVMSTEGLPVKVDLQLHVRVRTGSTESNPDLAAFRRKFMLRDGVVTTEGLQELLQQAARQVLSEFMASWRLIEAEQCADFRSRLEASLRNKLEPYLGDLGLALVTVAVAKVCHEALDEHQRLRGRLSLVREEQRVHDEHAKSFADLFNAKDQERIRQREQELKRKFHDEELNEQEAELAQRQRNRQTKELASVMAAQSADEATRMGAQDALEDLRAEYASKRQQREHDALDAKYQAEDKQAEWNYLKAAAGIKHEALLDLERIEHAKQIATQLARTEADLALAAAEADLKLARLVEEETARKAAIALAVEADLKARARQEQISEAQAAADVDAVNLAGEVRRREEQRIQALADARTKQEIDRINLETAADQTSQDMRALRELIELDHLDESNKQKRQEEAQNSAFKRKLEESQQAHIHRLETAAQELQRLTITQTLDIDKLVLLADNPAKIDALVKMATLQAHKAMEPEAIRASQSQAAAPIATPGALLAAAPAASAAPSIADQLRVLLADDRQWSKEQWGHHQGQFDQLIGTVNKAIDGLTAVGVANAGAGASPRAAAMPPMPSTNVPVAATTVAAPATGPAMLNQAFVQCVVPNCRALNPAGARFCTSCGAQLGTH